MFVATCYMMGTGVEPNSGKAIEFCRRAAGNENPPAAMIMGVYSYLGNRVPRNLADAERYLKVASDGGITQAQYMLGRCYASGEGFGKNTDNARKYLTLALDNNQSLPPMMKADALLKLADILENTGSEDDKSLAAGYRSQAASLPAPDQAVIEKMLFEE